MKPELEQTMRTQNAIYEGIRALQETNKPAATLVWWLHVVKNDREALGIVENPDRLQTNAAQRLIQELTTNPTVLRLTKELREYEDRYPEGETGALWMRTEIGVRALMGQPWVKGLVDLGR